MKRCVVVVLAGILAGLSVAEVRGQGPAVYHRLGDWFSFSRVAAMVDRERFLLHASRLYSDFSMIIADKKLIANGIVSAEVLSRLDANVQNSIKNVTSIAIILGQEERGRELSSELLTTFTDRKSWLERLKRGEAPDSVMGEAKESARALEEANKKLLALIGSIEQRR